MYELLLVLQFQPSCINILLLLALLARSIQFNIYVPSSIAGQFLVEALRPSFESSTLVLLIEIVPVSSVHKFYLEITALICIISISSFYHVIVTRNFELDMVIKPQTQTWWFSWLIVSYLVSSFNVIQREMGFFFSPIIFASSF